MTDADAIVSQLSVVRSFTLTVPRRRRRQIVLIALGIEAMIFAMGLYQTIIGWFYGNWRDYDLLTTA
jgi:hypothetical protein